jgi:hypothetical protein
MPGARCTRMAHRRIGAKRRPMIGSAKQSRVGTAKTTTVLLHHSRYSADFIITTSAFRFSVHRAYLPSLAEASSTRPPFATHLVK